MIDIEKKIRLIHKKVEGISLQVQLSILGLLV